MRTFAGAALAAALLAVAKAVPGRTIAPPWKRDTAADFERSPSGFVNEEGVLHLPIQRARLRQQPVGLSRRTSIDQQGLGDVADLAYALALTVGPQDISFTIDTGSADLWAATSSCKSSACVRASRAGVVAYNLSQDSSWMTQGYPITFNYGTKHQPTNATGVLGSADVTIAGWQVPAAVLSAINSTGIGVDAISDGMFGLAFPSASTAVRNLFARRLMTNTTLVTTSPAQRAQAWMDSLNANGGLIWRLAQQASLPSPSFSLSLQRAYDPLLSAVGTMTIGGLPSGVALSDVVYKPVYLYNASNNPYVDDFGIAQALPPMATKFEIQVDSFTVNGKTLQNSSLGGPVLQQNGVWALIDSGTTSVLGPPDLVAQIYGALGVNNVTQTVACETEFHMSVIIGGVAFPINPLDWVVPTNQTGVCSFRLGLANTPTNSTVHSWILGDVFMKNVLAHFYYGSGTASDPPVIGFFGITDADSASTRFQEIYPYSLKGKAVSIPYSKLTFTAPTQTTSETLPWPTNFSAPRAIATSTIQRAASSASAPSQSSKSGAEHVGTTALWAVMTVGVLFIV